MQCPACGYDNIADEVCYCPHCRHRFLEPDDEIFENTPPYGAGPVDLGDMFVENQVRQIRVGLLQPAILVMLATAAVLYLSSGRIAGLAVSVSSFEIRYGAFLCLLAGAITGWIFYRIMLRRIE